MSARDLQAMLGNLEAIADDSECVEDMLAWSWASFTTGVLVGLVLGVLIVAVPAMVIAWGQP